MKAFVFLIIMCSGMFATCTNMLKQKDGIGRIFKMNYCDDKKYSLTLNNNMLFIQRYSDAISQEELARLIAKLRKTSIWADKAKSAKMDFKKTIPITTRGLGVEFSSSKKGSSISVTIHGTSDNLAVEDGSFRLDGKKEIINFAKQLENIKNTAEAKIKKINDIFN